MIDLGLRRRSSQPERPHSYNHLIWFGARMARPAAWAFLLLAMATLSGCVNVIVNYVFGPNELKEGMNVGWSINLVTPPWWWPDEDAFDVKKHPTGKVEKMYFEEHGKPDFFRLIFTTDGSVIPYSALAKGGPGAPKKIGWIYLERKIEATFTPKGAEETPLTDEIKTICESGDPDEILVLATDSKSRSVRYLYRRDGVFITFVNGKKTETQKVPALPGWMRTSSI